MRIESYLVEYPPGGLWSGDCTIHPEAVGEYARLHRCPKHIIIVLWDWECVDEAENTKVENHVV